MERGAYPGPDYNWVRKEVSLRERTSPLESLPTKLLAIISVLAQQSLALNKQIHARLSADGYRVLRAMMAEYIGKIVVYLPGGWVDITWTSVRSGPVRVTLSAFHKTTHYACGTMVITMRDGKRQIHRNHPHRRAAFTESEPGPKWRASYYLPTGCAEDKK